MDNFNLRTKIVIACGFTAALIIGIKIEYSSRIESSEIRRTELQRYNLSACGYEAVQMRIDFDPGTVFGKHSHPGEEIIYVIEGLLEYEIEGKQPATLKAGDVLFIPAETIHSAKNVGSSTGIELATYIVEKEKPLIAIVK